VAYKVADIRHHKGQPLTYLSLCMQGRRQETELAKQLSWSGMRWERRGLAARRAWPFTACTPGQKVPAYSYSRLQS